MVLFLRLSFLHYQTTRIHLREFVHSGKEFWGDFIAVEFEFFQEHIDFGDNVDEILDGFGLVEGVEEFSDFGGQHDGDLDDLFALL